MGFVGSNIKKIVSIVSILSFVILHQPVLADASDVKVSSRIVGGQEVSSENVYPWMVEVSSNFGDSSSLCGGTLIDESWVLTAAHCVFDETNKVIADNVNVSVGDYERNNISAAERRPAVSEIIVHESYTGTGNLANDIALLRLSTAVTDINPLVLANASTQESNTQQGSIMTIIGWGGTEAKTQEETEDVDPVLILNDAQLPYVSISACRDFYGPLAGSQVCAGYIDTGGVDACGGDSGGPLVFDNNGTLLQVGLVSFGSGCAQAGEPGVYTSITSHLRWIASKIGVIPNQGSPAVISTRASSQSVALVAGTGLRNPASVSPAPVASSGGGGGGGSIPLALLFLGLLCLTASRFQRWIK